MPHRCARMGRVRVAAFQQQGIVWPAVAAVAVAVTARADPETILVLAVAVDAVAVTAKGRRCG